MTVVIVGRDSRGRTVVEWFLDEAAYYAGDRMAKLVANDSLDVHPLRDVDSGLARRIATLFITLVDAPDWDVSFVATHTVAEPGAPLEPIPGRAA